MRKKAKFLICFCTSPLIHKANYRFLLSLASIIRDLPCNIDDLTVWQQNYPLSPKCTAGEKKQSENAPVIIYLFTPKTWLYVPLCVSTSLLSCTNPPCTWCGGRSNFQPQCPSLFGGAGRGLDLSTFILLQGAKQVLTGVLTPSVAVETHQRGHAVAPKTPFVHSARTER